MVRHLTKAEKAEIARDFRDTERAGGVPVIRQIAMAWGVSRQTIYAALNSHGINFPRPKNQDGAGNASTKQPTPNSTLPGEQDARVSAVHVTRTETGDPEAAESAAQQA